MAQAQAPFHALVRVGVTVLAAVLAAMACLYAVGQLHRLTLVSPLCGGLEYEDAVKEHMRRGDEVWDDECIKAGEMATKAQRNIKVRVHQNEHHHEVSPHRGHRRRRGAWIDVDVCDVWRRSDGEGQSTIHG